jgi:2-polyprenyl-3-methyl-5-hydroxy-6-metoxy-1,4-benzoquinol methylase
MTQYQDYGYHNDKRPHNFGYQLSTLLKLIDPEKNKCILDVGCGNGYLVNLLLSMGYKAYGIDASEKGIAIANQSNPGHFFVIDVSTNLLPEALKELEFDTLISTEVIEHLYDPAGFVEFCAGILNRGGEFVISTPYHGYLKNLTISLLNHWDKHWSPTWLGGHIKFWSKKTLSRLLIDKGFKIDSFKGCGRLPYFWMSMIIKAQKI